MLSVRSRLRAAILSWENRQSRTRPTLRQSALEARHQPTGFVTFWGAPGVGKSHLLKGLVNFFRVGGVYARYALAADLLAEIRQHYSQPDPAATARTALQGYHNVRVLCLDELDTIRLTAWSREIIFHLLDGRFNQRSLLLTALALRSAPDELPSEWDYLQSRLRGGTLVAVGGLDMRLVLKK